MIRFSFNNSDEQVRKALEAKAPKIMQDLTARLDYWMHRLQAKIQQEYLSGQALAQRSGVLKSSIRVIPPTQEGSVLTASVQGAGGPAFYGAFFEEGGKGPYDIYPKNKQALAFFPGGAAGTAALKSGRMVGKSQIWNMMHSSKSSTRGNALFAQAGGVVVKSVHHPAIPKRPFMKPAAEAIRGPMVEDLQATVDKTLRGES